MAVIPMTKIRLAIYRQVADQALASIQKMGVLELSEALAEKQDLNSWTEESFPADYRVGSLEAAVLLLKKHVKHSIIKSALEGEGILASEKKIKEIVNHFEVEPILKQITHWETNLNHLTAQTKALIEQKYQLLPWQNWPKDLDQPRQSRRIIELTAEGNSVDREILIENLENLKKEITYLTIDERAIAIYALIEDQEKISALIKEANLSEVALPILPGKIKDTLNRIEQDLEIIDQHKNAINKELTTLSQYLPELKILTDYYNWQKDRHLAQVKAGFSQKVVFFEGWCPRESIPEIKATLAQQTNYFALEKIETEEEAPVEIKNQALFQPFESVTRLYGLPGNRDLDPTAYLAGFFFVFFGLSLTDIGYGFILSGLAIWLLYWYRLPQATKSLVALLALGGFSSILAGFLFGGFFGMATDNWPNWLKTLQIFDPIDDPLPIFYLVLILGVIQIVAGLILAIIRDAKSGQALSGWADNGPWLLAFGFIGLIVAQMINWLILPKSIIIALAIIVVALLIMTQGRRESHWLAKIGIGILSLYGLVGYLSDILSYSRLLALGLATTALAFSVNMIAQLAWEALPFGGALVATGILIAGHGFTIIVNVLGAFVHSARLQFVEFFKGFITGVGRPFSPLTRRQKYITLSTNEDY